VQLAHEPPAEEPTATVELITGTVGEPNPSSLPQFGTALALHRIAAFVGNAELICTLNVTA
jgi:hypothetical protein